jgi:hypothetical protein
MPSTLQRPPEQDSQRLPADVADAVFSHTRLIHVWGELMNDRMTEQLLVWKKYRNGPPPHFVSQLMSILTGLCRSRTRNLMI